MNERTNERMKGREAKKERGKKKKDRGKGRREKGRKGRKGRKERKKDEVVSATDRQCPRGHI